MVASIPAVRPIPGPEEEKVSLIVTKFTMLKLMIVSIILRVFISFTKQFFTFHSNRVKCENKFCPGLDSNPRPPAFAASVLPLGHEGFTVENEQHRG